MAALDSVRLLGNRDVYMPITPMFHVHAWGVPYAATMLGVKQETSSALQTHSTMFTGYPGQLWEWALM